MILCPCGQPLPAGFPGATVTCVCGEPTTLAGAGGLLRDSHAPSRDGSRSGGGPYRSSSPTPEPIDVRCPFCGNACLALARVCPHCDVRLENVRCGGCYSLQQPGSFTCGRCGQALELEPLLDATSAPCPRCNTPLEAATGGALDDPRVHECPRCGGIFVPREILADILGRAELSGPFDLPRRSILALDEVRYVPCPLCHATMNRVNWGRVSGVIVDECRHHGTWFDGGELTRVIAFASRRA